MEFELRSRANTLDGFGTYSPINVRFDQPLDLCSIANAHHADDDFANDVIYVVDVETGEPVRLDLNRGFSPTCCRATATQTRPSASARATTPTMRALARAPSSLMTTRKTPMATGSWTRARTATKTASSMAPSAKRCRAVMRRGATSRTRCGKPTQIPYRSGRSDRSNRGAPTP